MKKITENYLSWKVPFFAKMRVEEWDGVLICNR